MRGFTKRVTSNNRRLLPPDSDGPLHTVPAHRIMFRGPFSDKTIRDIKLYNKGEDRLAFKLKATSRIRFKVEPFKGFINPGEIVNVRLTCNSFALHRGDKRRDRITIIYVSKPVLQDTEGWQLVGDHSGASGVLAGTKNAAEKKDSRDSANTVNMRWFSGEDVNRKSICIIYLMPEFQPLVEALAMHSKASSFTIRYKESDDELEYLKALAKMTQELADENYMG